MANFARVNSVDALKDFRANLLVYAEKASLVLYEADSDIQRTVLWLKQEQLGHWKTELFKRREQCQRAKQALHFKKTFDKTPSGARYSCIDEIKALQLAQKRLDEARQKIENIKQWLRKLEKENIEYRGQIQGLTQILEGQIPKACTQLDNMVCALQNYFDISVESSPDSPTDAPSVKRDTPEERPDTIQPTDTEHTHESK